MPKTKTETMRQRQKQRGKHKQLSDIMCSFINESHGNTDMNSNLWSRMRDRKSKRGKFLVQCGERMQRHIAFTQIQFESGIQQQTASLWIPTFLSDIISRQTWNLTNLLHVPDICQLWYTTALFRPVKEHQQMRKFVKQKRQNWPKFRVLYAKKYTTAGGSD